MKESVLQSQICQWLSIQYPDVIFNSDSSGENRTSFAKRKAAKKQRSEKGIPDMWISEPRGGYHGLYLELKVDSPWKKDGQLKIDNHLKEQAAVINRLTNKGYCAVFAVGFDNAKEIIELYMDGRIRI